MADSLSTALAWRAKAKRIRELQQQAAPLPSFSDRGLLDFIVRISPRYQQPLHLAPLIALLDRAEREPVRAVISVPPRHAKTETLLHAFARRLRQRPWETIAYATYAADVAHSKSRLARDYAVKAGVRLRTDSAAVHEWRTPEGGGMLATGIGGPLTSHGAHLLVVDDPFANRQDAESAVVRQHVHEWFTSTAITRLEPGGSALVVHTRWHADDLAGRLIQGITPDRQPSTTRWEPINLPALDEVGRPLWPGRWPVAALHARRAEVGEYDWFSLFQGEPRPRGGAVFQEPRRYEVPDREGARIFIACDPAASAKTHADHSVIAVGAFKGAGELLRCDLLEVIRLQVEVPRLVQVLAETQRRYSGAPVHVEAVAGFKAVPQMLRSVDPSLRIVEIQPAADKFIRAQPAASAWNTGRIRIPGEAPWVGPFLAVVMAFTGVADAHDDDVDALAHLWNAASANQPVRIGEGSLFDL